MTPRRPTLTHWILIAMVAGVVLGWASPRAALVVEPLSTVFLRLIKSLIVPLVASTLIVGIAGHGDDMRRVGRLALRSVVYFEVVTTLALAVGLLVVNVLRPGIGVHLPTAAADGTTALAGSMASLSSIIEHAVPQSVFEAAANNDALQIVVWAGIFAVALTRVRAPAKERLLALSESVAEVTFRMVDIVMWFAPFGIGAALAATIARHGLGVLGSLGQLVLTLYVALIVFCVAVLVPVALVAGVPLRAFLRAVRDPALIAFSTSTSEAALPRAMESMEALGVPRRIVAFVIPVGYSFNLDGSTLYLAVAALFAAQAGGLTLSLGRQLVLMLTLMLTSKGVAGVPRAALVILSGAVVVFGLPVQAVALILGVDAFMDMARTTVNVVGNCLASVVVARWEGAFRDPRAEVPGIPGAA
jgi:proton glutamate symport protein